MQNKWMLLVALALIGVGCGANEKLLAIVDKRIDNIDKMPEKIAAQGSATTPEQFKRIHDDIARLKSEVHTLAGAEDGR